MHVFNRQCDEYVIGQVHMNTFVRPGILLCITEHTTAYTKLHHALDVPPDVQSTMDAWQCLQSACILNRHCCSATECCQDMAACKDS